MNDKNKIELFKEYCSGCGLCHSAENVSCIYCNGFLRPSLENTNIDFCEKVCPASGKWLEDIDPNKRWGRFINVSLTWSSDEKLRFKASSGGTITAISEYLIKNKIVDEILHVGVSKFSQIKTEPTFSDNEEQLRKKTGSRYTASNPLIGLLQHISVNKKYAVIGKPCDILTLRKYLNEHNELNENIVYLISFFCAGIPSENANKKLLQELGTNEENCKNLIYRGNGWPGFATATSYNGDKKSMSYNDSWGTILGRDINRLCRFCMDGIGEFADIACGDAWYLNQDGSPDFNEHSGRNVTFSRTEKGEWLLNMCIKDGAIVSEPYDLSELAQIQKYQYTRRSQVYARVLGMRLCARKTPNYSLRTLRKFAGNASKIQIAKNVVGTVKRVFLGKM